MEKKNIFKTILLILLILLFGLGLFGVLYKELNKMDEGNKKEEPEKETEVIDNEEQLLEKLMTYIPYYRDISSDANNEEINDVYKKSNSEIILENVSNAILYKVYINTNTIKDASEITKAQEECSQNEIECKDADRYTKTVDFNNVMAQMYNKSLNELSVDRFNIPGGTVKKYSNNYMYTWFGAGSYNSNKLLFDKKIEYKDNDILIKEKVLFFTEELENNIINIANYNSKNSYIKNYDYDFSNINYEELENEISSVLMNEHKEELEKEAKTFTHTFKMQEDGSYYWYSTKEEN